MKKNFLLIFLLLAITGAQAVTIKRHASKENICACLGTYARFSFEVQDGSLANVKVVNGSSNPACDKLYSEELGGTVSATMHPDGVTGIGVIGYKGKDKMLSLKKCLNKEGVDFDVYWFVEKISIDIEKINK